ncbi:hypothetical protein [Ornithinibacillus sp. JPR2-1]
MQIENWLGQLVNAQLLEQESRDDDNIFYYKLTEPAKEFLRRKGVDI